MVRELSNSFSPVIEPNYWILSGVVLHLSCYFFLWIICAYLQYILRSMKRRVLVRREGECSSLSSRADPHATNFSIACETSPLQCPRADYSSSPMTWNFSRTTMTRGKLLARSLVRYTPWHLQATRLVSGVWCLVCMDRTGTLKMAASLRAGRTWTRDYSTGYRARPDVCR